MRICQTITRVNISATTKHRCYNYLRRAMQTYQATNGDLNNTSAERPRLGIAVDQSYRNTSLAIPPSQDDLSVRTSYRPFLLENTENDWIAQLELSTVIKMVDLKVLQCGGDRLKVLVLYGSLRERYAKFTPHNYPPPVELD